jgi:hypothetical protein
MFKGAYHPKAFLSNTRNVKQGLATRTRIASALDRQPCTARIMGKETSTNYSSVMHHLHLMETESIVKRSSTKPYVWELTGAGQKKLTEM